MIGVMYHLWVRLIFSLIFAHRELLNGKGCSQNYWEMYYSELYYSEMVIILECKRSTTRGFFLFPNFCQMVSMVVKLLEIYEYRCESVMEGSCASVSLSYWNLGIGCLQMIVSILTRIFYFSFAWQYFLCIFFFFFHFFVLSFKLTA